MENRFSGVASGISKVLLPPEYLDLNLQYNVGSYGRRHYRVQNSSAALSQRSPQLGTNTSHFKNNLMVANVHLFNAALEVLLKHSEAKYIY